MLVRYYGTVGAPSGYGKAANETCMALLEAGIDLEIQTYGDGAVQMLPQKYLPLARFVRNDDAPPRENPDVVVVHTLPGDCGKVLEISRVQTLYPRARCFAYTTWEGQSPLPRALGNALIKFHGIWVPSRSTRERVLENGDWYAADDAVTVVPHAFDETASIDPAPPPPGTYRFYYIGAWTARKNVEGVIRAYLRAFSRSDDVELVIHASRASPLAALLTMVSATGEDPQHLARVTFTTERVVDQGIEAIHRGCHCFVTATRGEAWNLPAFEAMLARRHIIAPHSMGSDDFLVDTSAWLYRSTIQPASGEVRLVESPGAPSGALSAQYQGPPGLTVAADWREPDIAQLAILMRRAFTERVTTLDVRYDPAGRYGRKAVGAHIRTLLEGVL
jgi:glycosyltransferase involved in cell wall biosynthesis